MTNGNNFSLDLGPAYGTLLTSVKVNPLGDVVYYFTNFLRISHRIGIPLALREPFILRMELIHSVNGSESRDAGLECHSPTLRLRIHATRLLQKVLWHVIASLT